MLDYAKPEFQPRCAEPPAAQADVSGDTRPAYMCDGIPRALTTCAGNARAHTNPAETWRSHEAKLQGAGNHPGALGLDYWTRYHSTRCEGLKG